MKTLAVSALLCAVMTLTGAAGDSFLDKRSACSHPWYLFNGRCFRYFPTARTWASAERRCLSLGGNLASVHSTEEYHRIQRLILTSSYGYREAWIGGSDAQQEGVWLWTDGSSVFYTNWCPGEPNNHGHQQHCLQMNFSQEKCWDDVSCGERRPFVCAKRI